MSDASRLIQVEIAADPPSRLDKALARDVPENAALSRSRLMRLIAEGQVSRAGEVLSDPRARVAEGDIIAVALPPAVEVETRAEAIPLDIVHEDDALVVVNKPAGMVTHPAPGTPSGTLVNALLHHFDGNLSGIGGEKRPGIVHRIDKDTSGLLVVAKSDAAHHGLAAQFEKHSAERLYRAVTHRAPDPADPRLRGLRGVSFEPGSVIKITTGLTRHRTDRQKQAVVFNAGRHAVTRVTVVERFGNPVGAGLVECRLETGRTHQIRVHLAHCGHGLIGDPTYGGQRKPSAKAVGAAAASAMADFPRQALHAATLGFEHPVSGEWMRFEAPLPQDMQDLLMALRAGV